MNNKEKKLLIKAIAAFLLFVLFVVSVIGCFAVPKVKAWTYHAVAPGDTLWSIAKEYNPEYEGDVRQITYCIKKANGMDSSAIMAGDVLEVPVME